MIFPYRQVHLDFHTSPFIKDVGRDFDPEAFAAVLTNAEVSSINVFAKCHHGMSYYTTKLGKQHPYCNRDLLGEMLTTLKRERITANVYFPIGWEETAADHADWLEVSPGGILGGKPPFEAGFNRWRKLCLNNHDYMMYIKEQVTELMDRYEFAGFWFDIITQEECLCRNCIADIRALNLNPEDEGDRRKHDYMVLYRFQKELYSFVKAKDNDKTIFFNGSWAPDGGYEPSYNIEERGRYQTHIEIESIPSNIWSYNHFPLFVNYHNRHNGVCIGMNGKFHNAWGDFGSLRNLEALEFECFRMIMNGARCSIGDQLHPRGQLDRKTYEQIGNVYRQIKVREPWCVEDVKAAEIGIIMAHRALTEDFLPDEGALRMMLELHYQFDFIDWQDSFDKYKVLILPDEVAVNEEAVHKLTVYLEGGGHIIASHHSGLDIQSGKYLFNNAGIEYIGESEYDTMYLSLGEEFPEDMREMRYSLYERGSRVMAEPGTRTMAKLGRPYFNRTYDRFCSHRQFPYDCDVKEAGITRKDSVIYISSPLFTDYIKNGVRIYREIIDSCIKKFLHEPMLKTNLPVSAETTVRYQKERTIVHMIHYIAEKKSKNLEIVDVKLPLHDVIISVKGDQKPARVYLAPQNIDIEYKISGGYINAVIPVVIGHQMLVIEK